MSSVEGIKYQREGAMISSSEPCAAPLFYHRIMPVVNYRIICPNIYPNPTTTLLRQSLSLDCWLRRQERVSGRSKGVGPHRRFKYTRTLSNVSPHHTHPQDHYHPLLTPRINCQKNLLHQTLR